MNPDYYGIVEMVFTGSVVLGLAVWQLVSVSRQISKDREDAARRSAEGARHPVGEHLPDDG